MTWGRPKKALVYVEQEKEEMQLITVHFPKLWLEEINLVVGIGEFNNRSSLIRYAVKNLLFELRSNQPVLLKEVF